MGKIIPRSACSFLPVTGGSNQLTYGPQTLNSSPWQAINLGVGGIPCTVSLPDEGTYLLLGRIYFGGAFQVADTVVYGLYDSEQELEIGDPSRLTVPVANWEWEQDFSRIYTISSPRTVYLFANNNTGNRGGVIGIRTRISWVRLN